MVTLNPNFYYVRPKIDGTEEKKEVVSFSTQLVLVEAEKLGITWELIPETEMYKLNWNGEIGYFLDRTPLASSFSAVSTCMDKHITKLFLAKSGVSTPKGYSITKTDTPEYIEKVFNALQKPVVVKPTNASHGDGITIGLEKFEDIMPAVEKAFGARHYHNATVEIEEMFVGKEYRITVTRDKIIGVMHRIPANVTGDGIKTISQLVEEKNQHPFRNIFGDSEYQVYGKIKLDDEAKELLAEQSLTTDSIPEKGQQIFLKKVSNMMAGGDTIDLTDEIHPTVKELALKAINAIPGLAIAGIDFMTKDLFSPQTPETYSVVEVNHNAEFGIHHFPMVGKERNATFDFLQLLFPELESKS